MDNLKIQDFGPIADIDIRFGDLTFFIGPQASGKSIALETVKLAKDRDSIVSTLDRHNYIIGHDPRRILNVYFGEGMEKIWTSDTSISVDGERLTLHS
ncbi:MAG: ATP-binding protein, partial [Muribaculaceae bacterium]|nr:ATP-binding protein [Muribaculaceae bacterium]